VLQIRGFSEAPANEELLKKFAQTLAAANERLTQRGRGIRIWIEFA
jgi:hypothetical protein